jgi:hypothetical protein
MTVLASPKQIGLIHTLAAKAGMDEDTYRAFLAREGRVNSSKHLTAATAAHVIDRLKTMAGQPKAVGAVSGLDTAVSRKMRALWISAWDLGVVRDRTDRAMLAFLERQTGVSHTRFLKEPGAATSAIEALKGWLAREGAVAWPTGNDSIAAKRAVLEAQWLRLVAVGTVRPFIAEHPLEDLDTYAFKVTWKNGWCFFDRRDYDTVQAALGRKLRAALARLNKDED